MIIKFEPPSQYPLTTFNKLPIGHAFRIKSSNVFGLKCPDLSRNCEISGVFYFESPLSVPTNHFFENRICSKFHDVEVYDLGRLRIVGQE